jgi:hypothetical protein
MPLYNDKLQKLKINNTPASKFKKKLKEKAATKPLNIKRHEKSQRRSVQRASQTRY